MSTEKFAKGDKVLVEATIEHGYHDDGTYELVLVQGNYESAVQIRCSGSRLHRDPGVPVADVLEEVDLLREIVNGGTDWCELRHEERWKRLEELRGSVNS